MAVKVRPELYGLGYEEPDGKEAECVEVARFVHVLLRGLQSFHQEVSQGTVHDQRWWIERG